MRFALAVAALLPVTLCAQSDLPPQAGPHTGFPGWHGQPGKATNPNPRAQQAPPPAAKPSAAVPASQLPAMPVAVVPPPPPPPPLTPSQKPAQRATVEYVNGLVTVKANNSSLNQILRALMRQTGLKIDGGVAEERVYGVYGPAHMQTLLANLLDGTNTNILYLPAMNGQAATLTLTPRTGGITPPPPTASASDDLLPPPTDAPAQTNAIQTNAMQPNPAPPPSNAPTITVQSGTPPANPVAQAPAVAATPAPAVVTPAPAIPVPAPATPAAAAAAATPPAAPNTGHTAEDIVQQILQMRAAQQKAAAQAQKPVPPATPVPAATTPATAPQP